MPELPEVEFCRRTLERWTRGRQVKQVEVPDPRSIRASTRAAPSAGLPDGHDRLTAIVTAAPAGPILRHGKRLLWQFGEGALLLHLGMTGKWTQQDAPFAKVRLHFTSGPSLTFADPRLLGGVVPTTAAAGPALLREGLGPDAWGNPLPPLRGKREVKVALLDQSLLAGVGNIQAMESLWRARIHPATRCDALTPAQHAKLSDALQVQLNHTLKLLCAEDEITYVHEGGDNPFSLYQQEGSPCPVCETPIERMVQGGRGTWWCPSCQGKT